MNGYIESLLESGKKNFVFLGEAGCGKTEAAVNFAVMIAREKAAGGVSGKVHFFDMDQTKPLFRSRDVCGLMEEEGVSVHFEEQLLDARTLVGGPAACLKDPESIVIMDIGGDHQGSRMIGGFADLLKREDTKVFFMINSFRPWSLDIEQIDRTMAEVLGMARLGLEDISLMSNPNNGHDTTAEEVIEGHEKTLAMMSEYIDTECLCVMEDIAQEVSENTKTPVVPLKLYMKYDWE